MTKSNSMTGIYVYPNGIIYEGELLNGIPDGKGKTIGTLNATKHDQENPLDGSYVGEFKNGNYHGYGILKNSCVVYKGTFKNGLIHGHGKIVYSDDGPYVDSYEGKCYNGNFHGHGTYMYSNGAVFEGE